MLLGKLAWAVVLAQGKLGRDRVCDLLGQVRAAVPDIHSVIDQAVALASSKSRQQGEPAQAEMGNQKAASASADQVHTTVKYLDFDASSLAGGVASSALLMIGTA